MYTQIKQSTKLKAERLLQIWFSCKNSRLLWAYLHNKSWSSLLYQRQRAAELASAVNFYVLELVEFKRMVHVF